MPDATLRDHVVAAIRQVRDPEIPVNLYDLGLIYRLDVSPEGDVEVDMTLTSPACPVAGALPAQVESKIRAAPGVRQAKVQLVWEPPWTKDRMSDAARLALNLEDDSRSSQKFFQLNRPGRR